MSEAALTFVASIVVLLVWVAVGGFVIVYATWAPRWKDTPVGRMLMGIAATFWVLVTLALVRRWFPAADGIFAYLALVTYGAIFVAWVWALFVLVLLVRGIITPTRMNPHPVRDWLHRRFRKKV